MPPKCRFKKCLIWCLLITLGVQYMKFSLQRRVVTSPILSIFTLVLVLNSISTPVLLADAKEDFYIQQATRRYFNLPQNARTFGMAGSSVATSQDSSSVIGNPAGIGFMKDAEVSATYDFSDYDGREEPSYDKIQEDIDSGHALGAFPIAPNYDAYSDFGNIGLGWSGYRSDVDDSYDTETKGHRIHAAYGKALNESTSVGYGFSYFNDQLNSSNYDVSMDDGYRHTVGVQNKVSEQLTLGLSGFYGYGEPRRDIHIAGGTEGSQRLDRRSYGGEFGGSYDFGTLLLASSIDWQEYELDSDDAELGGGESGRSFAYRIGLEQEVFDWLVARAGYRYQGNEYFFSESDELTGTAKYNAASWGAGAWLDDNLRLDYGGEYRWVAEGTDWTHNVTVSMPFSICEDDLITNPEIKE